MKLEFTMKKRFLNALLCGAVLLSAGVLHSCKDDNSSLESEIRVINGKLAEMQSQLDMAIKTGASITNYTQDADGNHVITLSTGSPIVIPKGGSGGGSDVKVDNTSKPGFVIITVNDKTYELAMGSAVNSLIFSPEFADGAVLLKNYDSSKSSGGAVVRFLVTPAISAEALKKATFEVADAREMKARTRVGGGGLLKVKGTAKLNGDGLVEVPIRGLGVKAGGSYWTSIQMSLNGTTISSNYFQVNVADDYSFETEALDPKITIKSSYNPVDAIGDAGAKAVTINGLDLLNKVPDFKALFDGALPAGATFEISYTQANDLARGKIGMLQRSLKADGSWAFAERPGTAFNDKNDATQNGFRFDIVLDDQIKAKTYIVVNDELADVKWTGNITKQTEAEYGARWKGPKPGETIDLAKSFLSVGKDGDAQYDWEIIHSGRDEFFGQWENFKVMLGDEILILNDDGKIVMEKKAQDYAAMSRGVYWFLRGITIDIPEKYPAYTNVDGVEREQGKRILDKGHLEQGGDLNYTTPLAEQYGITISKDGKLTFSDKYTGFGTRLTIGLWYEYAYGSTKMSVTDHLGYFFFNRRFIIEGARMPDEPAKK